MATSTLTRRLAKIAKQSGAPKGTKTAMFDAFLKAAAPQIRSAFRARHDDKAVFDVLGDFFCLAQKVDTEIPLVEVSTTEHATFIKSQMPDQAFIVDTVLLTLRTLGIGYQSGFNLVLGMGRDAKGKLTSVDDPASPLESMIYVVADPTDDVDQLKAALCDLTDTDWAPLQASLSLMGIAPS